MHRVESVVRDCDVEPRPYQGRIVNKIDQMFRGEFVNPANEREEKADSVMVESPTGSGKTIIALLAAKTVQHEIPDLFVGWVAMRRNLLGQAAKENQDQRINVKNIHFVSMFDKSPEPLIRAKRAGRPVLLIIDEAQHDAASSMTHLHNIIEPNMILGMTATPFRTDKMKLCFQKVIKDAGIHSLIQDGYLSPYHHYTVPDWDPKTVADHYCQDPERWGKSAFYFVNLQQCEELASILRERGISLEVVTGSSNRDQQIERFEKPVGIAYRSEATGEMVNEGGCDVLINCMVLTEGWNFPGLKTAWVRDSGKGPTMQMGGRVFRKFPGLEYKQIVQSKNTKWPFVRTAMPAQSFVWLGEDWRSITVNPRLDSINQNARLAIAQTEVMIPKFILDNRKKRAVVWRG